MRQSKARPGCREYRTIPFDELPRVPVDDFDPSQDTREATDDELRQFDIHVFDRGGHQVQAYCNGYWDKELGCGVDARGNRWPGELRLGRRGMYGAQRAQLVEASLRQFENGTSGGRRRLMLEKLPEELPRTDPDTGEAIPPAEYTETERLARRLPRIMGDS